MKKLILFFVLFSFVNLFSQTTNHTSNAIVLPQGYGISLLNSSGSSSIYNDISNIGFMNPASISGFDNYSFGISYQVSTTIDEAWIVDFGTSRIYNFYPQSFGGTVKLDNFTFALGFGQKYNGTLETGHILITTTQDPDGTGEYFDIIQETIIHSYSLNAAYSFKELLQTSNDLSIGFRYSINQFNRYDEIWQLNGKATDYSGSVAMGLAYKILLEDARNIFIGVSYESKSNFKAKYETDHNGLIQVHSDTTNSHIPYEPLESYLTHELPSELKIDLAIDATQNLKLLTNLTLVFWKTDMSYLQDQVEYSTSVVYKMNQSVTSSLGFYYTDYNYEDNRYYRVNGNLNAFFITAGLRLNIQNYYADLAIADSHLFSGDYRKQTIAKLSVGVQL